MNHVIDQIAAYGRNGDTLLVHMAPEEVAGLKALGKAHGLNMTKNPDTGLPEMFNFKSLLPTLAGAALTIGSGGALSPLAAGLIVGAGTTAVTGDINQGLMAGLGGFGGAGLAGSLGAAGAAGAAGEAASADVAAQALAPEAGSQAATIQAQNAAAQGLPAAAGTGAGSQAAMLAQENAALGFTPAESAAQLSGSSSQIPGFTPSITPAGAQAQMTAQGAQNILSGGEQGEASRAAFGKDVGYGTMASAAAPVLGGFGVKPVGPEEKDTKNRYRGEYFYDDAGVLRTRAIPLAAGGEVKGYADGGLASLGKFVKGDGDGMSDDVDATIEGREPVMLSEGEYVVPAQAVSALGNGSTDAGVKKLDAMVNRIYSAQTGKPKQMKPINPKKVLPA